jgi:hypothetical protein
LLPCRATDSGARETTEFVAGATTVVVGTDGGGSVIFRVKQSSSRAISQVSSVTMDTSGIFSAAPADPAGNVTEVLHIYRSPTNPYMLKGLSKLYE